MNIALLAKKGGVGKSTVSVLLYEALRQAGKAVLLRDWDTQGTSTKALSFIGAPTDDRKPEIVIFDSPPNLEHTTVAVAVRSADIALVITSPSPADIWEAEDAVQFAQSRNQKAHIRVLFNKVRKTTLLGRLVEENAKAVSVPTLPVTLAYRECYQHAIGQGWKALDGSAREEVLNLAVSLLAIR